MGQMHGAWRLLFIGLLLLATRSHAVTYQVQLDTSPLAGSAAQLAFDLIDGDGLINNSVSVSAFTSDGVLGAVSLSGGASGSLAAGLTLADTDFFNEALQGLTLGNSLAFRLDLTPSLAGGALIPDSFAFFLLDDSASASLVTTSLLGDALFTLDLDGSAGGTLSVATGTTPALGLTVQVVTPTGVPEPSSWIVLLGLGALLITRRTPTRRA